MVKAIRLAAGAAVAALVICGPANAWVASAHARIAEAAVESLPDSMPPFFRAGVVRIGRSAVDPDFYRLRELPQLRNAESPEHYLDLEYLEGAEWPATRYEFLELVADLDRSAYEVGTLPYSLAESVQLLAASFAQVRLDPGDEWAQAKVLHHAGVMAHYSADLCQPLHTTIHFNGRARADGSSPGTGIHFKTDTLASAVFAAGIDDLEGIEAVSGLRRAIREEFARSHALVDRVYDLEGGLGPGKVSREAMNLGRERVTAAVRFTSSLFVTAWELSGDLNLPGWFRGLQPSRPSPPSPSGATGSGSPR